MIYEEFCKKLRPSDYADGEGLSEAGRKVEGLLAYADYCASDSDSPDTDGSWGHLTPEAQASDEAEWNNMLLEGKL